MTKAVGKNASVAWLQGDHPEAKDGEGYYEVLQDNENDQELDGDGNSANVNFTNTKVKFGERLLWEKNNPEKAGEPNDPNNNEGRFVYASSVSDDSANNGAGGEE